MSTSKQADSAIDQIGWNWDNSYARLPDPFFRKVDPEPVPDPQVVISNHFLAQSLGLDLEKLDDRAAANLFAGQQLPQGTEPLAQAYAGHQFGGFTILGDGRAILLGEHVTPEGDRVDIQFKGSGKTFYSRRGDGKAALGPMLREYLISEAMFFLGIPTSRSLAVVTTGQPVYRERVLPGSILTRTAASHIRVGTFQYFLAHQDQENIRRLADYTIQRHFPEIESDEQKYLSFFKAVIDRQAALIAQWQMVGFIHGVMNTDNMLLSGETIDYGPCAFMDTYHPQTVFSSIDSQGRYAYGNQPIIAQWNLARFAETILELIDPDKNRAVEIATEHLQNYTAIFDNYWLAGMRRKLGLLNEEDGDRALIDQLLDWMERHQADFTNTFRDLCSPAFLSGDGLSAEGIENQASDIDSPATENGASAGQQDLYQQADFKAWYQTWVQRLDRNYQQREAAFERMRRANPNIIPRNYYVEQALDAAQDDGDLTKFHQLLDLLKSPFGQNESATPYRRVPSGSSCGYQTFCGT